MRSRTSETYGVAAYLWNALYGAPPDQDAASLVEAVLCAMRPSAPEGLETLRSQARTRDIDFALRSMLLTCPAPDRLRGLVEQLGQAPPERPDKDPA